jgi:hypothetical protein
MSIGEYEGPSIPINPSRRRDDGRGCPSPGLARLPKVRDLTPEERFEKARWNRITWAPYLNQTFDDIARSYEGLLFLDHVRLDRVSSNPRIKHLRNPLCDFLTWPPVAEALQTAKDRAACEAARRPELLIKAPWET